MWKITEFNWGSVFLTKPRCRLETEMMYSAFLSYVFAPLSLSQWNLYPLWWWLSCLQNFRQIHVKLFLYETETLRLPLSISGDPLGLDIKGEAAKGTENYNFSEDPKANIPKVFFESWMENHLLQNHLEFYEKFTFPEIQLTLLLQAIKGNLRSQVQLRQESSWGIRPRNS